MTGLCRWSCALAPLLMLLLATNGLAQDPETKPKPKAKTEAPKMEQEPVKEKKEQEVKNKAPAFSLPDLDGKKHALADYKGKWVVLEWINHGCPFVKKHYKTGNMQALQKKYAKKGVIWLSVCSSAPGKQGYFKAEQWKKIQDKKGAMAKAVLLDPDGKVGRLYKARTTPQMVIINPKGGIVYDGAIDSKPYAKSLEQTKSADNYVAKVLDAVMAGKEAPVAKTKPYGCSVKYASP